MLAGNDPRSIYAETIFTRRVPVPSSPFIKAMHPKSEIMPNRESLERILRNGWVGQLKIHGHRAQIHIPADEKQALIAYTRQGKKHSLPLPAPMIAELLRLFKPEKAWTVIDAEWLKPKGKLFIFDLLKSEGESLRHLTFPERWSQLPRAFISPHVSVLPLLKDLAACEKALLTRGTHLEGLVFKSSTSTGFSDTSIVRCRRKK